MWLSVTDISTEIYFTRIQYCKIKYYRFQVFSRYSSFIREAKVSYSVFVPIMGGLRYIYGGGMLMTLHYIDAKNIQLSHHIFSVAVRKQQRSMKQLQSRCVLNVTGAIFFRNSIHTCALCGRIFSWTAIQKGWKKKKMIDQDRALLPHPHAKVTIMQLYLVFHLHQTSTAVVLFDMWAWVLI